MIIKDPAQLLPAVQALEKKLRSFSIEKNIPYIITETYRSLATITEYYKIGRRGIAGEKTITNISPNDPAKSAHYNRCAFDIALLSVGSGKPVYEPISWFKILGDYWVSLDPLCVWGGNWKGIVDRPHFEWTGYKTLA